MSKAIVCDHCRRIVASEFWIRSHARDPLLSDQQVDFCDLRCAHRFELGGGTLVDEPFVVSWDDEDSPRKAGERVAA